MAIENSAQTSSAEGSAERSRRPLRAVGLISTLSVALGVGSALAAMPIAGADTSGSGGASDATSQAPATRDTRGSAGARATREARTQRSSTSAAGTEAPARRTRVHLDSASTAAVTAGDNRASARLSDETGSLSPAVDSVAAVVQIADAATAAAAAPSLTAASTRASLSAPSNVLLSLLTGGGNPGAPDATPLAWAAVALTRRESSANAVAAVANSAASADPAVISLVDQYRGVLEGQVRSVISSTALADVIAPLVASGAADWILNGTVGPELTALASNSTVGAFIAGQTAAQLANFGVPQQISSAVGNAVAHAIQVAFGDATNSALIGAVDTFIGAVPWASTSTLDTLTSLVSGNVTVLDIAASQLSGGALQNAATALL
ncbi:MAG: hypothetical protein WCJ53_06680, partial [Mycobacteriaceae bacterium]